MNRNRTARSLAAAMLAAGLLAGVSASAWAKHRMDFNVEAKDMKKGEVTVPKTETLREDLVATGAITVDGTVSGDCVSMGSSVTVKGEVRGDVAALGGSGEVSGTVNGDLVVLGGPALVSGTVRGDVAAMGGDVTLADKAVVEGDVSLLGGKLHKAEGAQVKGSVTYTDLGLAKMFLPLASKLRNAPNIPQMAERFSPWRRLVEFVMFLFFAAGMGLMTVLLTMFLPKNVECAAAQIKADFWKTAGVGALILMLTLPGLLLMVVSVIGIPLIPVAILIYCGAVFMSLAACSLLLAGRFYEVRQQAAPKILVAVAQGYGLLVGLFVIGKFVALGGKLGTLLGVLFGLANMVLLSCGLVVGLGAVWLTRMGTQAKPAAAPAVTAGT